MNATCKSWLRKPWSRPYKFYHFFVVFWCQQKRIDRLFIRNPKNSVLCHLWGFCATSSWAELESLEVSVLGCVWGMDTSHARKGPGHELKHLEAFSFHFSSHVWCIAFRCVSKLGSFIFIYIYWFSLPGPCYIIGWNCRLMRLNVLETRCSWFLTGGHF